MSSLALLMQNYSDSEDDRSSDEESKRKRIKKLNNDDKINEIELKNDNLNQEDDNKTDESNDSSSPPLNKLISQKRIEEKNLNNQKLNYHQDYLDDDFYTVNSNDIDKEFEDEEENTIESNPSIIELDNNEEKSNNDDNIDEKLESSRYSPKSFHRNLIGIDEEKIRIPEAPKDKECSQELIDIINDLHSKMRNGKNWIETISQKKSFRNPSIYEKLIGFCGIDEFGTNLPIEVYDIEKFRKKETTDHNDSHE